MSAASELPVVTGIEDYQPWFDQDAVWLPAMASICRENNIQGDLTRIPEGSAIVFACGEVLIKLLPPFWRTELEQDLAGLQRAWGRLPVATPEVLGSGRLDEWSYALIRRLPGQALKGLWKKLDADQQVDVARQIGELMAQLQQLDASGLDELTGLWPDFVARQAEGFVARQQKNGLAELTALEFDSALKTALKQVPQHSNSFLHSDLTDEHLLLEEVQDRWRITGLIDFGDLMAGWGPYDLAAPCALLSAGRPEIRRALLQGYGQDVSEEQFLALQLLHRFCHLPWLLKSAPEPTVDGFLEAYCRL